MNATLTLGLSRLYHPVRD